VLKARARELQALAQERRAQPAWFLGQAPIARRYPEAPYHQRGPDFDYTIQKQKEDKKIRCSLALQSKNRWPRLAKKWRI
jgi:hypothetical protein